jgi:hypothetical protein
VEARGSVRKLRYASGAMEPLKSEVISVAQELRVQLEQCAEQEGWHV